jgi:hypothetical protein
LEKLGMIECVSDGEWAVLPLAAQVAHRIKNPPRRDYRNDLASWFWSKPWSIPVRIVFVGLPAVYGYFRMVADISAWLAAGDTPSP